MRHERTVHQSLTSFDDIAAVHLEVFSVRHQVLTFDTAFAADDDRALTTLSLGQDLDLTVDFGDPQTDPLNPYTVDNGFNVVSDLRMPEWPASPFLDEPAAGMNPQETVELDDLITKIRDEDGHADYKRTCVEGPVFDATQIEW